jgi:hypothetical protein
MRAAGLDPAVWGTLASADLCGIGTGRAAPDQAIWAGHLGSDDPRGDPCTPVGRIVEPISLGARIDG